MSSEINQMNSHALYNSLYEQLKEKNWNGSVEHAKELLPISDGVALSLIVLKSQEDYSNLKAK